MDISLQLNEFPAPELALSAEWRGSVCRLELANTSAVTKTIGEIIVFSAPMPFSAETEVFGEGYNKLAQYGGTVKQIAFIGSFSDYDHYKLRKPDGFNQVYNMAIFSPTDSRPHLLGFCSCFRFSGCIRYNTERLELVLNCENIKLLPGERIKLEEIYAEKGERNEILSNFSAAILANHPRPEFTEIPTGWCSWLTYGPFVTEKNVYDNLEAIEKNGLNLKYIQIDDGYQRYMGDWLSSTDKFAGGVQRVCKIIKEKGFEPAIWVAPFIAQEESAIFKAHPDWFIKDEDGMPLPSSKVSFGGWRCAPWYMLDVTHPDALDYLRAVFRTMRNDWGVRYFKLDANMWGALPFGRRYDNRKTCIEAYRLGMEAILEAVGSDGFILGCNAPVWPSIGVVHGMRVTNDNSRCWKSFVQIAKEGFRRNWMHNKLWINDPDTVLLQNNNIKIMDPAGRANDRYQQISTEEFKVNAAYTMATGGMVLSSDDITSYTTEQVALLKKLLPPVGIAAEFDDESFAVGKTVLSREEILVFLFNLDDFSKKTEIDIGGRFLAFDLFEEKDLGIFEEKICFSDMPAHSAKVLRCKKLC